MVVAITWKAIILPGTWPYFMSLIHDGDLFSPDRAAPVYSSPPEASSSYLETGASRAPAYVDGKLRSMFY